MSLRRRRTLAETERNSESQVKIWIGDFGTRISIVLLVACVTYGCTRGGYAFVQTTRSISTTQVKDELRLVAEEFRTVAYNALKEPEKDESLGLFFRRCASTGKVKVTQIRFNSKGDVVLSDGSSVSYRAEFGSCILFMNGGSQVSAVYRFTATGHNEEEVIELTWTFGNPYSESEMLYEKR